MSETFVGVDIAKAEFVVACRPEGVDGRLCWWGGRRRIRVIPSATRAKTPLMVLIVLDIDEDLSKYLDVGRLDAIVVLRPIQTDDDTLL